MNILTIKKYISKSQSITISDMQETLSLSCVETIRIMSALEDSGIVKFVSGLSYKCIAPEATTQDYEAALSTVDGRVDKVFFENQGIKPNKQTNEFYKITDDYTENHKDEPLVDIKERKLEKDEKYEQEILEMRRALERRRALLEERKRKILQRLGNNKNGEAQEKNDAYKKIANVRRETAKMPNYNEDEKTFTLNSYPDGSPILLTTVLDDNQVYLTDCGKTIDYLCAQDDIDDVAEYLRELDEPVSLINNAIAVPVKDDIDLQQDSSDLLRIIDGLLSQGQLFDMRHFPSDMVEAAQELFNDGYAEASIKILAQLKNAAKTTAELQKSLSISNKALLTITEQLRNAKIIFYINEFIILHDTEATKFERYLKGLMKS